MKKIITAILCASAISLGCASPVPNLPIQLSWEASPDESLGMAYVVYELLPTPSANWVVLTNVPTSTKSVILDSPQYRTIYTVTLMAEDGITESPMSNPVTNLNLRAAGPLTIHR